MKKKVSASTLRKHFKEQGVDLYALFDPNKYDRYIEKNWMLLKDTIESNTEWKVQHKGVLEFVHPDYPEGRMLYNKVGSMNDIKSVDEYVRIINELGNTEYFLDMIDTVVEHEEIESLSRKIDSYLKEKHKLSFEELLEMESGEKRNRRLNGVFKAFAGAQVKNNNLYLITPNEKEVQFTSKGRLHLEMLRDTTQTSEFIRGTRTVRDIQFSERSEHVRKGRGVSKRQMDRILKYFGSDSIESVIEGKDLSEPERADRLQAVHFYLSEVNRDKENDMVFPHPEDSRKRVVINDMKGQSRYFEDIHSLDELIEKVKNARSHRDTYYQAYENAKEEIERRKERLNNKDRGEEMGRSF